METAACALLAAVMTEEKASAVCPAEAPVASAASGRSEEELDRTPLSSTASTPWPRSEAVSLCNSLLEAARPAEAEPDAEPDAVIAEVRRTELPDWPAAESADKAGSNGRAWEVDVRGPEAVPALRLAAGRACAALSTAVLLPELTLELKDNAWTEASAPDAVFLWAAWLAEAAAPAVSAGEKVLAEAVAAASAARSGTALTEARSGKATEECTRDAPAVAFDEDEAGAETDVCGPDAPSDF